MQRTPVYFLLSIFRPFASAASRLFPESHGTYLNDSLLCPPVLLRLGSVYKILICELMEGEKSMLFNKAHAKVYGLLSRIKMDLTSHNERKNKYIIGIIMIMVVLLLC